jgi:heterodisulfide reductase subunit A-like polyferredoxin
VDACLAHAVDHSQQAEIKEIDVGSVILTAGCQPYDPAHLENVYHYKTSPNVLTSLEFERILAASGPTMGHLQRPSDGKDPKKIPGCNVSVPETATSAATATARRFAACMRSRIP